MIDDHNTPDDDAGDDTSAVQPKPKGELHPLSVLLAAAIDEGKITRRGAREAIGIVESYLKSLLNGNRKWSGMPLPKLREVAKILGMLPKDVFNMAGASEPSDWLDCDRDPTFNEHFNSLRLDGRHGPLAPTAQEWRAMPFERKRQIALLWLEVQELRVLVAKAPPPPPPVFEQPEWTGGYTLEF